MRMLSGFILGVLFGVVGTTVYLLHVPPGVGGALDQAQARSDEAMARMTESVAVSADRAAAVVDAKLAVLHLRAQDVEAEMKQGGAVIRRRAGEMGEQIADAASDARITASIEAALVLHPELSTREISVSTSGGSVTLTGNVPRAELSSQAMLIAYETEGVREVISTIRVEDAPVEGPR